MTDFTEPRPVLRQGSSKAGLLAALPSDLCASLGRQLLYPALVVQCLSAFVFVGELWSGVLGLRHDPIPWVYQEYIQTLASVGLVLGVVTTGLFVRHSRRRITEMGQQIDVASGKFQAHMEAIFDDWDLSASEKNVALLAMKGFSNREIAELRGKSASTIKSQLNAVFRKSGLTTRQQLTAFLVEEMMSGIAMECEADD